MSGYDVSSVGGVALIASGDEWSARTLDSVLQAAGHRVVRVSTGAAALEGARSVRPDVIIVAAPLPDLDGVALCRALRRDVVIGPGVMIVGVAWEAMTREQRLSWLRAGAWEVFGFPFDPAELVLKLERYLEGKRNALRAGGEPFVDETSGLYTERGLKRRAHELVAEAVRLHTALACVAFGAESQTGERARAADALSPAAVRGRVGRVLRTHARLSDTVGWLNGGDFAVLAPATDALGAAQLAQRLVQAVAAAPGPGRTAAEGIPGPAVRAGYEAVTDVYATRVDAEDLLARAGAALASARARGTADLIRRFEGEP